jgi:hypothetical protein
MHTAEIGFTDTFWFFMKNEIDEMLSMYGLIDESSILPMLNDFKDEEEVRELVRL